jgi:hypothetical protein
MGLFKIAAGIGVCFALLLCPYAHAFEMECGTYEVVGRFDPAKKSLVMYEGTEALKVLHLYGTKLLTDFAEDSKTYYRLKIQVPRKIGNGDGSAHVLEVLGLEHYDPKKMQYKRLHSSACR